MTASPAAVEWPAVGSKWKRVIDHAVADGQTIPLPPVGQGLIVTSVDPADERGLPIRGELLRLDEDPKPYATSHAIFYDLWEAIP